MGCRQPGAAMHYSTVLELHPNREVRIGYHAQRTRQRSGGDTAADAFRYRYHEAMARLRLIDLWVNRGGYLDTLPNGHTVFRKYTSEQHRSDRQGLLDIISVFQENTFEETDDCVVLTGKWFPPLPPLEPIQLDLFSPPPPDVPRPFNGLIIPKVRMKRAVGFCDRHTVNKKRHFGNAQRRALLRTGAVMSRLYPDRGQTYEVTLTIPGGTVQALKCVAGQTSWLTNRLMQIVRDKEKKNKCTISWFYVWEWQERGALHLHMALGSENALVAKKTAHDIEYQWFELLMQLEDITGIDCFARKDGGTWRKDPSVWQSHVAEIEKNLAAYFAKYASKDKDTKLAQKEGRAPLYYPKTWWGRSRDLAQAVKDQTVVIRMNYQTENECIEWYKRIDEILGTYVHIKEYRYDFQVERPVRDTDQMRVYAFGERLIRYYEDDAFADIKDEVETLAAWMRNDATNNEWTGRLPRRINDLFHTSQDTCVCSQ